MARPAKDDEREERIQMEIIVDAYSPEEQALGWYYHLEGTLQFPFTARCIARRATSPLEVGDEVEVVGMPAEEECEHDMLVLIYWRPHELAVPLRQLEGIDGMTKPNKPLKIGTIGLIKATSCKPCRVRLKFEYGRIPNRRHVLSLPTSFSPKMAKVESM